MGIIQKRLINRARAALVEALGGTLLGDVGGVAAGDNELIGFRPISERIRTRDLDLISQDQMIRLSLYLYTSNPLARWLVNTPVSLAVGRELGYSVDVGLEESGNEATRKAPKTREEANRLAAEIRRYLDPYWTNPVHNIGGRAPHYARTYLATGHLILPITGRNEVSGAPQLDLLDAGQLRGAISKSGFSIAADTLVYEPANTTGQQREVDVIRPNPDGALLPLDPDGQGLMGALYFPRTLLLNSLRGISYLMDVADWLDANDQTTWTSVDRAKLRNAIVWHLTVKNAKNDQAIQAEVDKVTGAAANPGTVYGSNENVTLEAKGSNVTAEDTVDLHRLIRNHVLGAKGMPESWYGEGSYTNRATAGEQTDVAYKVLGEMQAELGGIFRALLHFGYDAIQQRQTILPKRTDSPWLKLEPALPVIQERDISRQATVVTQLESAIESAIEGQLVSRQTGRRIFVDLLAKLANQPIELDQEVGRIEAEKQERATDTLARANEQLRRAIAGNGSGRDGRDDDDTDDADVPPRRAGRRDGAEA